LTSKKIYFFSDVHLGLKSPEVEKLKERKVIDFLRFIAADAEKIFILGDLFDCWIEYRKVVPKGYFRLLSALNETVESGIEINFLSGNHDFWLNSYLRDEVGLKIFYESYSLSEGEKKYFLVHGDGLSRGDLGYKIIKKILRSRTNQFLYSLIHPDLGIALAQSSSRKSRGYTNDKTFGAKDGMREYAEARINEGYDYVIMGHVHRPQQIELVTENGNKGYFVILGDWIKHDSYGVSLNGNFQLKYWEKIKNAG
jgi:UDP-2,3-diacylglucosamine hydrolase